MGEAEDRFMRLLYTRELQERERKLDDDVGELRRELIQAYRHIQLLIVCVVVLIAALVALAVATGQR